MSERNLEAYRLAQKVVSGSIIQRAAERLVYQIVESCAEHEKENTAILRARIAKLEEALSSIANTYDESWQVGCQERRMGDMARAALTMKPSFSRAADRRVVLDRCGR